MSSRRVLLVILFLFGIGAVHSVFAGMGDQPRPLGQPESPNHAVVAHRASLVDSSEGAWYRHGALLAGVAALTCTFFFAASGSKGAAGQR